MAGTVAAPRACRPDQVVTTRFLSSSTASRKWLTSHHVDDNRSRRNCAPVNHGHRSPAWYPLCEHQRQRPEIHLAFLARHVEPIRHPPIVLICLSPANRWSDRTDKSDHRTVDSHELPGYSQVGRFATDASVFLQQHTHP
ncbi:hypothetical protein CLOM_g11461, partial [Closterium sp. NIES-68]